jgi:hypothetical protein
VPEKEEAANLIINVLSGKHLYELDYEIAYFLTRAPDRDMQGARWELLERR